MEEREEDGKREKGRRGEGRRWISLQAVLHYPLVPPPSPLLPSPPLRSSLFPSSPPFPPLLSFPLPFPSLPSSLFPPSLPLSFPPLHYRPFPQFLFKKTILLTFSSPGPGIFKDQRNLLTSLGLFPPLLPRHHRFPPTYPSPPLPPFPLI